MTELVVVRGIPGAGKSTFAREWVDEDLAHRAEVNRETLRAMLHGGQFVKGVTEGTVIAARDAAITSLLKRGISVVSSDTNLPNRTVRDLIRLAEANRADWRIRDLTDITPEEAVARNRRREDKDPLPSRVIWDMYERYVRGRPYPLPVDFRVDNKTNGWAPYVPPEGKPPAIIVDIDGTVALKGARDPYDLSRVHEDQPNQPVVDLVLTERYAGAEVLFVSGRQDTCRTATEEWLHRYVLPFDGELNLFMRPAGNTAQDAVVKYEIFNRFIRDSYRVKYVCDDRDQTVRMWREVGLACFQVNYGAF